MVKRMFDFDLADDALELVSYNYKDDPRFYRVEIPAKYKFRKVKSISPKAFSSASFLKEIVIPDSVGNIGAGAFEFCESLENIVLPQNLKIIDYNLFRLCTSLRRIELPEKAAVIRSFAFSKCASLERVTLPGMLCVIYNGAFEDCSALREVVYPESEVMILGKAFRGCGKLNTLPAIYSLIGFNDLNKPFRTDEFDWNTALREDVFPLAAEHGCFENINKAELFRELIDRNLINLMPQAESMLSESLTAELLTYAAERGRTEFSARLLNANRRDEIQGSTEDRIADLIDERFSL